MNPTSRIFRRFGQTVLVPRWTLRLIRKALPDRERARRILKAAQRRGQLNSFGPGGGGLRQVRGSKIIVYIISLLRREEAGLPTQTLSCLVLVSEMHGVAQAADAAEVSLSDWLRDAIVQKLTPVQEQAA